MAGEVGDRVLMGIACNRLGECHLLQGDHEKAITVLEEARAIADELGYRDNKGATSSNLGRCYGALEQYDKAIELFEQSLAIHEELDHKPGGGGTAATCTDILQQAKTWLRAALDLAVEQRTTNLRVNAQLHLACVALLQGDEAEAVELLSQHLQGLVDDIGPRRCLGCGQVRGEDAPMLSCEGCRVARCVYIATLWACSTTRHACCSTTRHACRAMADREASVWMGDSGIATQHTSEWRGGPRARVPAAACRTRSSARCCAEAMAKGKATVEWAGLREEMVTFLRAVVHQTA